MAARVVFCFFDLRSRSLISKGPSDTCRASSLNSGSSTKFDHHPRRSAHIRFFGTARLRRALSDGLSSDRDPELPLRRAARSPEVSIAPDLSRSEPKSNADRPEPPTGASASPCETALGSRLLSLGSIHPSLSPPYQGPVFLLVKQPSPVVLVSFRRHSDSGKRHIPSLALRPAYEYFV